MIRSLSLVYAIILALAIIGAYVITVGKGFGTACPEAKPAVTHFTMPTHKVWRVTSVQSYIGLEKVELVSVDYPTPQDPTMAFALTEEGMKAGSPVCLDHVEEIKAYWAHPRPEGGCPAR